MSAPRRDQVRSPLHVDFALEEPVIARPSNITLSSLLRSGTNMALILHAFISNISVMLLKMAQDEVGLLLGIPGKIEKLSRLVGDIRCVLSDAERRQSESQTISQWILELKDLMYDADDIIDLCQIKAGEHSDLSGSSCYFLNSCLSNPVFSHKIGRRIKVLNYKLEGIVNRTSLLGLIEHRVGLATVSRSVSTVIRSTDSLIVQSDIVGEKIEEDTNVLVDWITKKDAKVAFVAIVAIVGVGGIGKTTLAKKVFNDQRIEDKFQVKLWVCVSKVFIERDLLNNVIREAGGIHSAAQERSELVPLLKTLIARKKFLLVLDDVWRESEKAWHGLLREPLMSGARGSRIIVTTRDETVAMRMRAIHTLRVDKLQDDDAWSLLVKQVFLDGEEHEIENLKVLGFDIVKKCSGLPLAIKVISGVLCTKNRTESDWQAVLSSTLWSTAMLPNDVHAALYLSFEDLPPHLKQCFTYCSLYPENWEFSSAGLIHLWHAQGFLEVDGTLSFWETGLEYYKELVLRNLLEANSNVFDQARCKMHDLLLLFGRYLGKNECFITREGQNLSTRSSLIKVRHLLVQEQEGDMTAIKEQKSVRSLLLIKSPEIDLTDVLKSLCSLRVLDLSYSNISSLPDSLCLLVHLRYFSAGGSSIASLPNAIGKLKNLEFLGLGGCQNLTCIPESIVNLVKLRILNLYRTEVKGISVGLRKLSNLVELQGFKPHGNTFEIFSSLDELAPLLELRTLVLENMENVSNSTMARLATLSKKLHLKHITFEYHGQNLEKEIIEDVLNELSPPSCLEQFMMNGYYGCQLPSWLYIGTNLQNLRYLSLRCLAHVKLLALGHLPKLEFLYIKDAHSVVSIGSEFLGGSHSPSFPSLRRIIFEGMHNWKIWKWEEGQEVMPNLKELVIRDCPELSSLPSGLSHHETSLEYLEIIDAGKIKVIENFLSLEKLVIYENANLERVCNLPKVWAIWIRDCPNLEVLHDVAVLRSMVLNISKNFLPRYLQETQIEKLTVWCNATFLLKIVKEGEGGSEWQKFQHIQQANFYTENRYLYIVYRKAPFSFTSDIDAVPPLPPFPVSEEKPQGYAFTTIFQRCRLSRYGDQI